jgi:UDP-glucose 4-epimerase
MKISEKNVLVVGGAGYLGSHVADQLSHRGFNVTVYDRNESSFLSVNQKMIVGGLDLESLCSAMADMDYVFNFAAVADIQENNDDHMTSVQTNVIGALNVFESCRINKVKKLLHASTMYVYSDVGGFYRATKQSSEAILEAFSQVYGLNHTILRFGSLYGPRAQPWNGLRKLVEQILTKGKIVYRGDGEEMREYIHVKDAASIAVDAMDTSFDSKSVMITGNQCLSSKHILSLIFEIVGTEKDIAFDTSCVDKMHYKFTPFRYQPSTAVKLSPTQFVDLGQGIVELLCDIKSNE